MYAMINDMIDVTRLRVKPLVQYQYTRWKKVLMIIFLGVVASAGASGLGDNIPGRMAFCVVFVWLKLGLLSHFMRLWLRLLKRPVNLPLFGLVLVCNGIDILSPLTSWFPSDVGMGINSVLVLLGLVVMVNSIAVVSGLSRLKVLLGMMVAGLPLSGLVVVLVLAGLGLGWINLSDNRSLFSTPPAVTPVPATKPNTTI